MRQAVSGRYNLQQQLSFRSLNAQLLISFNDIIAIAKKEHQEDLVEFPTGFLFFKCECCDRDCKCRIKITLKTWIRIHKNTCRFCIYPSHCIADVEEIVETHKNYQVVQKKDCINKAIVFSHKKVHN